MLHNVRSCSRPVSRQLARAARAASMSTAAVAAAGSPRLPPAGAQALDTLLHREVDSKRVPALFFGVASAHRELYFNCAGDKVFGEPEHGQVDSDTLLQLFSMTKLATAVACLQLHEQGVLSLYDPEVVREHLPDLDQRILTGYDDNGAVYATPRTAVTLAHLLSHTSGLAYPFYSNTLRRWRKEHGVTGEPNMTAYVGPLIAEPGTHWIYSFGNDYAGFLLERLTGQSLDALFRKNIWDRLGAASMTFYPTHEVKDKLMTMCFRKQGQLEAAPKDDRPGGGRSWMIAREMDPSKPGGVWGGGGGLIGTARDYLRMLQGIMASREPGGIISPESFKILFTDVLPSSADQSQMRADLGKIMGTTQFSDPNLLANGGQGMGHSIGFSMNTIDSKWGRKAGSGCWDGAAKTEYWLDPESGIVAVCASNLLAKNPDHFFDVYNEFERTLYDQLE